MTRRIQTLEDADAAMAKLGWLRSQGHPNHAVKCLWDCAAVYRAEVTRMMIESGEARKPGFVDLVESKRK